MLYRGRFILVESVCFLFSRLKLQIHLGLYENFEKLLRMSEKTYSFYEHERTLAVVAV